MFEKLDEWDKIFDVSIDDGKSIKKQNKTNKMDELITEIKKETGWKNLTYLPTCDLIIEEYANSFKEYVQNLIKNGEPDYQKVIVDNIASYYKYGCEDFIIKSYSGIEKGSRLNYICEIVLYKDQPILVYGYVD